MSSETFEKWMLGLLIFVVVFLLSIPPSILWNSHVQRKNYYHSLSCVDVASGKVVFSAAGQHIFTRSYTGVWEIYSEHGRDKSYNPPPNTVCSVRKHKRHDLDPPENPDRAK